MCKLSVIISCGPTVQSQVVLRRFLLSFLTLCFWQAHHSEPRLVHSVLQYPLIYILQVSHLFHPKLTHFFFEPKQCFEHFISIQILNQTLFIKVFRTFSILTWSYILLAIFFTLHPPCIGLLCQLCPRSSHGERVGAEQAQGHSSLLFRTRSRRHPGGHFSCQLAYYFTSFLPSSLSFHLARKGVLLQFVRCLAKPWESYSFIHRSCHMVIISEKERRLVQHDLGFFVLIYSQHNRLFPL